MSLLATTTLGLLLGMMSGAPVVDVGAAARGEVGGGYIPVTSQAPAVPAGQGSLELRAGLRLRRPIDTLVLRMGPRLYGLVPNNVGIDRPLVFYSVDGSYQLQLSQRWKLDALVAGGAGELSYGTLSQVFNPGTGTVSSAVIPLATASAQAGVTWLSSRRNSLSLQLRGGAQRSLSDGTGTGSGALPNFFSAGFAVVDEYRATRNDGIALNSTCEWLASSNNGDFVFFRNSASWQHRSDAFTTVTLVAGADVVYSPMPADSRGIPNATIEYATGWGGRAQRWVARYGGGIRGFFDRLNFTYRPQGFVQLDLDANWNRDWQSGLRLFASTSVTDAPFSAGAFETFLGLDLPNARRLSETLDFVFGARSLLRGPHISTFEIETLQGQFTVFAGFAWNDGTDRERGNFMQ